MRTITFLIVMILGSAGCPDSTQLALQIDPATCAAPQDGPQFSNGLWVLGASTVPLRCPVPVQAGDTLSEWAVYLQRVAVFPMSTPSTTAVLQRLETVSGLHVDVGQPVTDGTTEDQYVPLEGRVPQTIVTDDDSFSLMIVSAGIPGDRVGVVTVSGIRP